MRRTVYREARLRVKWLAAAETVRHGTRNAHRSYVIAKLNTKTGITNM